MFFIGILLFRYKPLGKNVYYTVSVGILGKNVFFICVIHDGHLFNYMVVAFLALNLISCPCNRRCRGHIVFQLCMSYYVHLYIHTSAHPSVLT